MPIERWSEHVIVAHLSDDPQFSEDIRAIAQLLHKQSLDVVLNFSDVNFLNSSNIAGLLQIRRQQVQAQRKLVLCGLDTRLWSVFLVTGIDKIFQYSDDVSTSLATLQLQR
ncbi:MAG: STAS domain-containing protein [Phycisphaerales bacterium]|nr:STAS domain-containing protein [Phycisphaerales bacterium]